jgi:DNA polymerase delta subunit 1
MEYQAIAWDARDDPDTSKYTVTIFGRSGTGEAVSVRTHFQPYFFAQTQAPRQIHDTFDFIKAKTLWGFTNNEPQTFVRFQCDTHEEMRRLVWRCRNKKVGIFEANVDPLLRFMHRTGVQSTGWFRVEGGGVPDGPGRIFVDNWREILPVERDDMAPLRIMSLDIETYSSTGSFPDAEVKDDVLFQIAMTMNTGERKCFSLGECHHPDTECFESEKELLERWSRYIVESDPDVITGWNIFGFDLEYIYKRMVVSKCHPDTFCFGKDPEIPCELKVKELSSGALGSNVLKMVPMVGRYVFDLFHVIKAEHKLESYSLNNVSKHFLGDTKNDMPIHEMFAMYRDRKDLTRVAEYCLKDTELPLRLMEKLCTVENLIEMAKATWVPLNFLSERGQQIKVFSQFVKKARELKFMVPTFFDKPPDTGKYEGATVLDAQCGAYYTPITALDFASLYPSIMMAHNLCYSTLVMDKKYANIPGVTYETHGDHTFAQGVPSLLPEILKDLKLFRKKAKGDMKKFPHLYNVYNGKQLAYKISMNSVYGFTGAARGMLPCVPIASTVTLIGRGMIQKSKEYVEEHFPGAKVRYGDSVMPGTPVLTKHLGPVCIENLGSEWVPYPGFLKDGTEKEHCELTGVQVWTSSGWSDVKRVIRHKCQKKIWRVLTHTGLVDVTEDHSLLGPNKELLKPKDVSVGTELLHGFNENINTIGTCTAKQAYIYGMFVGDGSCGVYGSKFTWAINNSDYTLLEKCKEILEEIHGKDFKILQTLESSGVYKLVPNHGDLKSYVLKYRYECYDGQAKKVPSCVLSSNELRMAFLEGLWDSDGCRKDLEDIGCHRIDTKNQITAQWYFILLRQLGYLVSLNTHVDKTNVFRLTWTDTKQRKNSHSIKKLFILHDSYDGYVYDLETEDGTFQAGVGQLIVKNTDSIMVEFDVGDRTGQDAINYSWELGERASKEITGIFKAPNELELEKVYCPYFLYSKKRYAAKKWEGPVPCTFKEVDIKGLQVIRRDNCQFVRDVCQTLIDMILESSNPEKPLTFIQEKREELTSGRVPMEKLILSKRLGDSYKNNNLAHVTVRDKMKQRAPGSEPQSGDRVQFVILTHPEKRAQMFKKAESYEYARDNELTLDYQYYLKHQFENPVKDLLEPLVG